MEDAHSLVRGLQSLRGILGSRLDLCQRMQRNAQWELRTESPETRNRLLRTAHRRGLQARNKAPMLVTAGVGLLDLPDQHFLVYMSKQTQGISLTCGFFDSLVDHTRLMRWPRCPFGIARAEVDLRDQVQGVRKHLVGGAVVPQKSLCLARCIERLTPVAARHLHGGDMEPSGRLALLVPRLLRLTDGLRSLRHCCSNVAEHLVSVAHAEQRCRL
mmetsp:Transcript_106841/g.297443  ORF Transcript_106841/g.297443 Transcript_106841/m.297443 type:complete len:215 (+) Transcript_106841:610-1254(+)